MEENKTDEFIEQIQMLLQVLEENPQFSLLLTHPRISGNEKIEVVKEVFSNRIDKELVGFLIIVVKKGRYGEIREILQYFLDAAKELKGIGVAYVRTPMPISPSQKKQIEDQLLATTKYQSMEMHYQLEESLIGGMQIRIKDRIVDSSVRTKLLKMQQGLMKIQI